MTNAYKKPFSAYLAFIEHELGCKLFDWQKEILLHIYDDKIGSVYFGRRGLGLTTLTNAAFMLVEEMRRDEKTLPPRLYELDGYFTTVVTCDENWGENTEWERENSNETS